MVNHVRSIADQTLTIVDGFVSFLPNDPKFLALKGAVFALRSAISVDYILFPEETIEIYKGTEKAIESSPMLASSPEFYQSMLLTHEVHSKTRNSIKREYIRRVYLDGYLQSKDLEDFELERMYDVAQRISIPALQFMKLFDEKVFPIKLAEVETYKKENPQLTLSIDELLNQRGDSLFVDKWIYARYNLLGEDLIKLYPDGGKDPQLVEKYSKIERDFRAKINEICVEMVSLGIMQSSTAIGGDVYSFSQFGRSFKQHIKGIAFADMT